MATDFNHKIKQQDLLDLIVDELYENAKRYAPFYQGTKKQMIKKAELYTQDASKVYTDEIVDVIVCATANVIGYNLAIFQNIGGQAIIISTQCIDKNTNDTLYLKYDYCPGFDSTNHYSTIVIKKNEVQWPTQPPASKLTAPPPSQPTQPPASNPTPPPPSQPTQPPASNPTPPPPSQPTQPTARNPAPPPTPPCEKLQEESSENEEPVNIEHIQNQIDDL